MYIKVLCAYEHSSELALSQHQNKNVLCNQGNTHQNSDQTKQEAELRTVFLLFFVFI